FPRREWFALRRAPAGRTRARFTAPGELRLGAGRPLGALRRDGYGNRPAAGHDPGGKSRDANHARAALWRTHRGGCVVSHRARASGRAVSRVSLRAVVVASRSTLERQTGARARSLARHSKVVGCPACLRLRNTPHGERFGEVARFARHPAGVHRERSPRRVIRYGRMRALAPRCGVSGARERAARILAEMTETLSRAREVWNTLKDSENHRERHHPGRR